MKPITFNHTDGAFSNNVNALQRYRTLIGDFNESLSIIFYNGTSVSAKTAHVRPDGFFEYDGHRYKLSKIRTIQWRPFQT